ncbi:uncharacterized protein DUF4124 [Aquabacterium commune]|jgi:hypothetical protein|uniref:Uncharacterized protein DUF4124 n=3 Tax=Aquabacterium TaxID=92793 RepID=A0A4V3CV71_9BURK|nr:DUF4124 domain-containing protein [Aquabacterium commune]TDP81328.1 uncharacterized protein DUF4124 [Aquabacterium commune]
MSLLSVADDRRSNRLHRPDGRGALPCAMAGMSARASVWLGLSATWLALAAPAQAAGIYSCVDANGKRHTSDRPIAECLDREQRVLNKDGSQRQTLPPRMNAEERALAEERQRLQEQAQAAQKDAVRRDRNLMLRFPDEAAHNKAREAALDDLRRGVILSERRLQDLRDERQPLLAETEFYKGRRLPYKLKSKLEANDAQQQAQRDIIQNQNAETVRINALYDAELARLRRLWAGAAPGSVPPASDAVPARKR